MLCCAVVLVPHRAHRVTHALQKNHLSFVLFISVMMVELFLYFAVHIPYLKYSPNATPGRFCNCVALSCAAVVCIVLFALVLVLMLMLLMFATAQSPPFR